MSIHDETRILKQPYFDDEGHFRGWEEFSPKSSANSVILSVKNNETGETRETTVAEALTYLNEICDYSWLESSGGSTSLHYPCVYLGAGNAVTVLSAAADHSVTIPNTVSLDFLILGLPTGNTPKYSLSLLTEEKTPDTAARNFTQRLIDADRYTVTLTGSIAHVKGVGTGTEQLLLDSAASPTERSVVGVILTAYIDINP